jgi:hypothetical protein
MDGVGESDSDVIFSIVGEHLLRYAEQTIVSGDSHGHGAELTYDILPFRHADRLLPGGDRVHEFKEPS